MECCGSLRCCWVNVRAGRDESPASLGLAGASGNRAGWGNTESAEAQPVRERHSIIPRKRNSV